MSEPTNVSPTGKAPWVPPAWLTTALALIAVIAGELQKSVAVPEVVQHTAGVVSELLAAAALLSPGLRFKR